MLFSQGFRTAEALAQKVVPLFILCEEQLSAQSHYDFGLRSLKSVLVSAGNIKRDRLTAARESVVAAGETVAALLRAIGLDTRKVAVERNEEIVPRSTYAAATLAPGDVLEIVHFIGGG